MAASRRLVMVLKAMNNQRKIFHRLLVRLIGRMVNKILAFLEVLLSGFHVVLRSR